MDIVFTECSKLKSLHVNFSEGTDRGKMGKQGSAVTDCNIGSKMSERFGDKFSKSCNYHAKDLDVRTTNFSGGLVRVSKTESCFAKCSTCLKYNNGDNKQKELTHSAEPSKHCQKCGRLFENKVLHPDKRHTGRTHIFSNSVPRCNKLCLKNCQCQCSCKNVHGNNVSCENYSNNCFSDNSKSRTDFRFWKRSNRWSVNHIFLSLFCLLVLCNNAR